MKHTLRLAAAALAAVALAMLGTAVPTANAADPGPAAPNPALINPDATVQLDIHKYLGTDTGLPNNGTVQTVSLPPLSGVNFDVYQVYYSDNGTCPGTNKVNLTTNAGWAAASAITGYTPTQLEISNKTFQIGGAGAWYCLGTPQTVTTVNGTAIFNKDNGVGLYLVNENLTSSGVITNTGVTPSVEVPKSAISPAAPFFVTLPMTNPAGPQTGALTTWMYDVNVYPKNQADSVTKTVVDKGTQTSEATGGGATHALTYTITSSITDGMTALQMGEYVITDTLDPRLTLDPLTTDESTSGVSLVIHPETGSDIPLTRDTGSGGDYTVTGNVVISFTTAGLVKLAANATSEVVTTIRAHLTGLIGDGTIENTAYVIPNKAWDDTHTTAGVPSEPVTSEYGAITVLKYAAGDTGTPKTGLTGAKFAIYKADSSGQCSTANMVSTNQLYLEQQVGSDGQVTFDGLQVSTVYNGLSGQTAIQYCLVETQAPTGPAPDYQKYNLLAEPIAFTVNAAGHNTVVDVSVPNQKANLGNNLPFTGGQGVAVISIGGALLVGAGLGYYLVFSRRRRNAQ